MADCKDMTAAQLLADWDSFREIIEETHPENPFLEGHTFHLHEVEQEIRDRLLAGGSARAYAEQTLLALVKAIPAPRSRKAQAPYEAALRLAAKIEESLRG